MLAIVALLLGAVLSPLATQQALRKNKEAERELREIKEALIGFAIVNGRLPWPDTDFLPDGLENVPSVAPVALPCTICEGLLPWQTLGVSPTDPWGRLYVYRISSEFGFTVQTGQPAGVSSRWTWQDAGTHAGQHPGRRSRRGQRRRAEGRRGHDHRRGGGGRHPRQQWVGRCLARRQRHPPGARRHRRAHQLGCRPIPRHRTPTSTGAS